MDSQYIVFQNHPIGFKEMPEMRASTLSDAIKNITKGSQVFMYHIYTLHDRDVPVIGTRLDVYQHVKTVAGSEITQISNCHCHFYALTHKSSMAWFFSDNIFDC